jgi:peroxiredoxin Q/BCP
MERNMALKTGDPAPDFQGITQDGTTVRLSDFAGRKLVLYFYPKDDTPGCTRQACSLRDQEAVIGARGAAVLGVSTQDQASHRRFAEKHHLNFPLLADPEGVVARAYGAIGGGGPLQRLVGMLGLARRVTFIIDEQGRIAHIIDEPETTEHATEVLRLL